jgi:hypothetical protein
VKARVFRTKRDDTLVSTIEAEYGVDFNARGDMTLRTLLTERGFDSLTQILTACRGRLTTHAKRRRIFISHHRDDIQQVNGLRLMAQNENVDMDFYDASLTVAVQSENNSYVKSVIRQKIERASIVLCLIGNGTASREMVDWELRTAVELRKGVCGVRIKESHGRTPPLLREIHASIASWNVQEIVAVIEQAAARRS